MIINTNNYDHVMRGPSAQVRYSLAVTARLLADDIAQLRQRGGIPPHIRTVVSALTPQRVLAVDIFGLSLTTDPERTTAYAVMTAVFELASAYNIVGFSDDAEILFTQRILVFDGSATPYAGLVGTAMGSVDQLLTD